MSVLQINQNIISLNALRSLGQVSRALAKNVERLSTGLRINRAADDAAGLTISERLRAQVRGLKRASQNAQEAISLIQTAEGALSETNGILQRIRELAIQAANGILTQNDRGEIQREVDQLIDEIDRIATSTQFNSKNLLNGDAAALTSVDDPTRTSLVVTDDVGKGGNFIVNTQLLRGPTLAHYKSDHMHTIAGADRVGIINGEVTYLNSAEFVGGASNIGLDQMEVQSQTVNGRLLVSAGSAVVSVVGTSVAVGADTIYDAINSQEITLGTDRIRLTGYDVNGSVVNAALIISVGTTWTSLAAFVQATLFSTGVASGLVAMGSGSDGRLHMSVAGSASVVISSLIFSDVDLSGSKLNLSVTAFSLSSGSVGIGDVMIDTVTAAITANSNRYLDSVGGGDITTLGNGVTGQLSLRFNGDVTVGSDEIAIAKTGENELQQYGILAQTSTPAGFYTFRVSALTDRTYRITNLDTGSVGLGSIGRAGTSGTLNLDTFQGLRLSFDAILVTGETGIIHVSTNSVLPAQNITQLQSIAAFIENGVFKGRDYVELGMAAVPLGRTTSVLINKTDTLEDLTGKISLALANPLSTIDLNLEETLVGGAYPDLVHYNLTGPAQGTISLTSPIPGVEVVFSGDESTINALSLFQIQETTLANYKISVVNLESGALVAYGESDTGVLRGVLAGVEIRYDITQGFKVDPDGTVNQVVAPYNLDPYTSPEISITSNYVGQSFVHIVPNSLMFQIGPNQGQQLKLAIAQMDAQAIGLDGILMLNQESAERAITQVDGAIDKVASFRSKLGSIQNRLESTIRNLDISHQNLSAAESGIRDLNVAEEVIDFTRNQILLQSGTAVLAQSNQLPQNVLTLLR
ncbi:MAG: flagellin [bacterium]|nr:flagellin [bacterium]